MKTSKYNVFTYYQPDDVYLGYNCVSGGMYVFNEMQFNVVREIIADPNNITGNGKSILREKMIKGQFIIEDPVDEMNSLKLKNDLAKYNPNGLGLVITPTLSCNFNCHYCYVDRQKVTMNQTTINKIKKFFRKKVKKCKNAGVCWTGGEPLIALEVIEQLNPYFSEECKRQNGKYESSMITNGYLLTPHMEERLKNCGIDVVQITLDGHREHHNKIRFTLGKKDTYDKIMENVIHASNNGFKIILRANIDKNNYEGIYRLIDEVAETNVKKSQILFAPSMVMDTKTGCSNYCGTCFSNKEFSMLEPEIVFYSMKKGFRINKEMLSPLSTFCGANTLTLYVVDSHANILKCWCNLGNAQGNKVGYIDDNGKPCITDYNTLAKWMAWDPFAIKECSQCNVLPLCMGGCMYYNVMGETDAIDVGCSHRKHNIEDILKLYYLTATKNTAQLNEIYLADGSKLSYIRN